MEKIQLGSGRLAVRVLPHGHPDYARMRFDWTCIADSVIFDGVHSFANSESPNPNHASTGGLGFSNEFKCEGAIEAAGAGEEFMKIGVGALTRPDDKPYNFMLDYPLRPFACETDVAGDSVTFDLAPMNIGGYAAALRKTLTVEDAAMTVSYTMRNAGERVIDFSEYNHNFVSINNQPIGKDYKLAIDFIKQSVLNGAKPSFEPISGGLGVMDTDRVRLMYVMNEGILDVDKYSWTLVHDKQPVGMREIVTWKPAGISVWGVDHVISPEVFFAASLEPGEEVRWERRWEFFYR